MRCERGDGRDREPYNLKVPRRPADTKYIYLRLTDCPQGCPKRPLEMAKTVFVSERTSRSRPGRIYIDVYDCATGATTTYYRLAETPRTLESDDEL